MATKLSLYILSERFQEAFARAVARAAKEARAVGLPPAGSPVKSPPSKRRATVVYLPPKPTRRGEGSR